MSAGRLDFIAKKGSVFARTLTRGTKDDPTDENEAIVPEDITGKSFRMQIRDGFGAQAPLILELTTTNGFISVVDPLLGTIALGVGSDTMETLPDGKFKYDLEMYDAGDPTSATAWLEGCFTIKKEATV